MYYLYLLLFICLIMQLKQGPAQLLFKIFLSSTQDTKDLKQKNTISMQNINTIYIVHENTVHIEHDSTISNHKQITDNSLIKQAYFSSFFQMSFNH